MDDISDVLAFSIPIPFKLDQGTDSPVPMTPPYLEIAEEAFSTIRVFESEFMAKGAANKQIFEMVESLSNSVARIQNFLPIIYDYMHTRGMQEYGNGFQSLFLVFLEVIEKLHPLIKENPYRKNRLLSNLPGFLDDFTQKRWSAKVSEFVKQLHLLAQLFEAGAYIGKCSEDLFITTPEYNSFIFQQLGTVRAESFFGSQFGSQFPPDIQTVLRVIMIASTSFSTARGKSENWFVTGVVSMAYGAYFNMFSTEAAEKFVESQNTTNISELKQFWNLTENPLTEKASTFGALLGVNKKIHLEDPDLILTTNDQKEIKIEQPKFQGRTLWVSARVVSKKTVTVTVPEHPDKDKEDLPDLKSKPSEKLPDKSISLSSSAESQKPAEKAQVLTLSTSGDRISIIDDATPTSARFELFKKTKSIFNFERPSPKPVTIQKSVSSGALTGDTISIFPFNKEKPTVLADNLVIHFHGGGFVAHTSSSHLTQLTEWTKVTETPILTINYRLAPEYQYPVAVEESFFAYCWALKHAAKIGSKAKKVIVIGDSAGGNLAAAVTVMAIEKNIRVPDGVILIYPALFLDWTPSPSRMLSVIDPMLPLSFLERCFNAYLPQGVDMKDPHLSPGLAPDNVLKQFPKHTYVMCGTLDPLFDDSVSFVKRMYSLERPIPYKFYEGFPHGWLNLGAVPSFGKAMWDAVKDVSTCIKNICEEKEAVFVRQQQ